MDAKTHYTAKELIDMPGLPNTQQNVTSKAKREGWPCQKRAGRGGPMEYPITCLPELTRAYLARKSTKVGYQENPTLTLPLSLKEREQEKEEREILRQEARAQSVAMFNRMPEKKRKPAEAKLAIITACAHYINTHGLARFAGQNSFAHEYNLGRIDVAPWVRAQIRSLHAGTLRNWIHAEDNLGITGLVDCYGNRKGQSKIETYTVRDEGRGTKGEERQPLKDTLIALILDKPHIKATHAQEVLRAVCKDAPLVSVKSVERYMERWKAEHQQEYMLATNPDAYKNKYQASFGSRSEGITGPNQKWEIDATPADLLLIDGRHKIIGVSDVGPRRLKFLVTKTERAVDNAAAVRRCLIAWGVPAKGTMVTDNGNPYASDHFMRVMRDLDIEQHFCKPFSGDEKPHIERGFGTFSHDLVELLPGYCGHSVAERKAIEARKSFAQRLKDPNAVIEIAMTAADLQAFCDRWCVSYHDRVHSSLGMSPNQALAAWPHAISRITDERALDILLAEAPKRRGQLPTVQKKGIVLDKGRYIHPDLHALIGQQVRVLYDPDDLGRIIVQARNEEGVWNFACIAEDHARTGISRAEVAAVAKARQNRAKSEMRAHAREMKKGIKNTDIVQAVLEHREEQMANVVYLPRPALEYTTSGLQAAAQAAAVLDGSTAPAEQAPEVTASRDRLQAEMAQPESPKVFEIPHEPREKYRLWCGLDGLIMRRVLLSDDELRFYEAFRKSRTYRAFRGVEEDIYSLRRE